MSMYNSAYTVCALSIDRYFAVASPVRMRKYRTKQIALTVVVFIWFFAFVWYGFQKYVFVSHIGTNK